MNTVKIVILILVVLSLIGHIRRVRKERKAFNDYYNNKGLETNELTVNYTLGNGKIKKLKKTEFNKFSDNKESNIKKELAKKWNMDVEDVTIYNVDRE